jgi:hypothetical protein
VLVGWATRAIPRSQQPAQTRQASGMSQRLPVGAFDMDRAWPEQPQPRLHVAKQLRSQGRMSLDMFPTCRGQTRSSIGLCAVAIRMVASAPARESTHVPRIAPWPTVSVHGSCCHVGLE